MECDEGETGRVGVGIKVLTLFLFRSGHVIMPTSLPNEDILRKP